MVFWVGYLHTYLPYIPHVAVVIWVFVLVYIEKENQSGLIGVTL